MWIEYYFILYNFPIFVDKYGLNFFMDWRVLLWPFGVHKNKLENHLSEATS